jgi:hypothetical protein
MVLKLLPGAAAVKRGASLVRRDPVPTSIRGTRGRSTRLPRCLPCSSPVRARAHRPPPRGAPRSSGRPPGWAVCPSTELQRVKSLPDVFPGTVRATPDTSHREVSTGACAADPAYASVAGQVVEEGTRSRRAPHRASPRGDHGLEPGAGDGAVDLPCAHRSPADRRRALSSLTRPSRSLPQAPGTILP